MFMMFYSVTVSRISKAILLHFVGKFINNVYNNNCVYISLLSILFTAEILYIECFFFSLRSLCLTEYPVILLCLHVVDNW